MSKINIGLSKNPNIKNVEIDKDFKDITFSEIQEIVKLFYPNGDTVIGWSESPEKTKVTLKSKYHQKSFEIEKLPLKKAIQCQNIMNNFRKIKGYTITSLSYNTKGVTSIELSVF